MSAAVKTKRCDRCTQRRIKCDKNWPQCSACLRDGVACSGRPATRFVHSHPHNAQPLRVGVDAVVQQSIQAVSSRENIDTMKVVASRTLENGHSLSTLRVSGPPLRPYPTTVSDRVAHRLVAHLETSTPVVREYLTSIHYLTLLPACVTHCSALRDCVTLFVSSWTSFQQGLPCSECTDGKLYGKTLNSMRQAIRSGRSSSSEMLAAISLLERYEIMFDAGRPLFWSSHTSGIVGLMRSQGPPEADDELGTWLALDNYFLLTTYWVCRGGYNFYEEPHWKAAMRDAIGTRSDVSETKKNVYRIELYAGQWTSLVQETRLMLDPQKPVERSKVLGLKQSAVALVAELTNTAGEMIEKARIEGTIRPVEDPGTPVGTKYDFADVDALRCLSRYAMMRIVLNRIIWTLGALANEQDTEFLALEHLEFCRMIWMCLPYVRSVSLMAAIQFGDEVFLSYEAAPDYVREYLLTWVTEVAQFRKRMPDDRKLVEEYIFSIIFTLTGRGEPNERPDFPYWKLRSTALDD